MAHGAGAQVQRVGAGFRLGHPVRGDQVARDHPGQVRPLLRLGAERHQRQLDAPHLRVEGEQQPVVLAPVSQRLHDQGRRDDVAARAAQLGGNRQALDPELGTPPPRLPRELPGILALHQIMVELPPGELRRRLRQLALLSAQCEVHAAPSAVRQPSAGRRGRRHPGTSQRAAKLHHGNLAPRQHRHLLRHDAGAADVVAEMGEGGTRHEPSHNRRQ